MHPTAALLALHGFRPYGVWGNLPARIKRGARDGEKQLSHWAGRWSVEDAAGLELYTPADWSTVEPAILDTLPQYLLDRFLQTD